MIKKFWVLILFFLFSSCNSYRNNRCNNVNITYDTEPFIFQKKHPYQLNVVIVIDVFRAATTAAYILANNPANYILTNKGHIILHLAENLPNAILIGKSEKGSNLLYHAPNSPTRVQTLNLKKGNILHRTEAASKGVLLAKEADIILLAGFVNADATLKYIAKLGNPKIMIFPMGHEATQPSLEDDLCAKYIKTIICEGTKLKIKSNFKALKEGPGKYFFSNDQQQYPESDFDSCLEIDKFNFAIRAKVMDNYAILTRCD